MGISEDMLLRPVKKKFVEWRRTRRGSESIPDALWDEVYGLEQVVGRTRLKRELGLNSSQIAFQMKRRENSAQSSAAHLSSEASSVGKSIAPLEAKRPFVAITKVVSVPMPNNSLTPAVEIQSPSGWVLRLQADANPLFLHAFIEAAGRAGGGA